MQPVRKIQDTLAIFVISEQQMLVVLRSINC